MLNFTTRRIEKKELNSLCKFCDLVECDTDMAGCMIRRTVRRNDRLYMHQYLTCQEALRKKHERQKRYRMNNKDKINRYRRRWRRLKRKFAKKVGGNGQKDGNK